jgi:hypothetical protein
MNVALTKQHRILIEKLLCGYIYYTENENEAVGEGSQFYFDCTSFLVAIYGVSWEQAEIIVNEFLDKIKKNGSEWSLGQNKLEREIAELELDKEEVKE